MTGEASEGDHARIIAVMDRYARAIDARDEAAFRSCFADEVKVDNAGNPTLDVPGEEWAAQAIRAVGFFDGTEHRLSSPEVTLDGDVALYTASVEARHWNADTTLTVFARYSNRLTRSTTGWRIAHFVMQVERTETGPGRPKERS